jgi:hypothetical protein
MALTRTTEQDETLVVQMSAADAFRAATVALDRVGKVKSAQVFARIAGRVRGGTMNMNPAEITISVEPVDPGQSRVTFHAIAQEGLIPQGTASKAITRVLDGIPQASPRSSERLDAPAPPSTAAAGASTAVEIEHLSRLHAQGALTDAEFSAAKRKLLGT